MTTVADTTRTTATAENTQSPEQQRAMAQYIHDTDPYDHLIVVHTFPNWPLPHERPSNTWPRRPGSRSESTGLRQSNNGCPVRPVTAMGNFWRFSRISWKSYRSLGLAPNHPGPVKHRSRKYGRVLRSGSSGHGQSGRLRRRATACGRGDQAILDGPSRGCKEVRVYGCKRLTLAARSTGTMT
jgi:hypothetical protein